MLIPRRGRSISSKIRSFARRGGLRMTGSREPPRITFFCNAPLGGGVAVPGRDFDNDLAVLRNHRLTTQAGMQRDARR